MNWDFRLAAVRLIIMPHICNITYSLTANSNMFYNDRLFYSLDVLLICFVSHCSKL